MSARVYTMEDPDEEKEVFSPLSLDLMDLQQYIEGLVVIVKGTAGKKRSLIKSQYALAVREYNSRRGFRAYYETLR